MVVAVASTSKRSESFAQRVRPAIAPIARKNAACPNPSNSASRSHHRRRRVEDGREQAEDPVRTHEREDGRRPIQLVEIDRRVLADVDAVGPDDLDEDRLDDVPSVLGDDARTEHRHREDRHRPHTLAPLRVAANTVERDHGEVDEREDDGNAVRVVQQDRCRRRPAEHSEAPTAGSSLPRERGPHDRGARGERGDVGVHDRRRVEVHGDERDQEQREHQGHGRDAEQLTGPEREVETQQHPGRPEQPGPGDHAVVRREVERQRPERARARR